MKLGLKTLVLKVSQCDDDLDDVENGMADMKQWLLRMKGLQDVHISGVYVSLGESVVFTI